MCNVFHSPILSVGKLLDLGEISHQLSADRQLTVSQEVAISWQHVGNVAAMF